MTPLTLPMQFRCTHSVLGCKAPFAGLYHYYVMKPSSRRDAGTFACRVETRPDPCLRAATSAGTSAGAAGKVPAPRSSLQFVAQQYQQPAAEVAAAAP